MLYNKSGLTKDEFYVAPVLGNGNMTFQVDYEGGMYRQPNFETICSNMDLRIWWAARRYMHKNDFDLVSFGCFGHRLEKQSEIKCARQSLDTKNAIISTVCQYEGGEKVSTDVFIHHDYNLIAVKKSVNCGCFSFEYCLCDVKNEGCLPELLTFTKKCIAENYVDLEYEIAAGMYPYKGKIIIFGKNIMSCTMENNKAILKADGSGEFYILFTDNIEREDYISFAENTKQYALEKGFDALKNEHSSKWIEYFSRGYASVGDDKINDAYNTAQYHMKCYTTDWSIPVGLNNGSWQGRYFAFDEFYMLMGLLTSNHMQAAEKIPKFRYAGLDEALFRSSVPRNEVRGALYPWETLENGKEGAPKGFWLDHVFHMACISCGGYYYYKFTGDTAFLEKFVYPVIKSSAIFYMHNMIYTVEGGRVITGKCTDLERLGSYRENAYMTTCGIIKTLLIFDEVSKLLGIGDEFSERCRETAVKLKRDLPCDGNKYIPYANCSETSIGLISGTYPFDVIERDSILQMRGIESYLKQEEKVGNMYSVGSGVCSWYMTWKAVVFARMNKFDRTMDAIKKASLNTGYFGEMYEISDISTKTVYRPWFTTAAGMLVHSVNEMLLQSDDDMIYFAPAVPVSEESYSFRLAVYGGIVVEAEVQNLTIKKLLLTKNENCKKDEVKIKIPKHLSIGKDVAYKEMKNGIMTV